MALGLALMMGIRLPINFNSPYKALNIIDFWRRWHMTLSRFLRDYVYIGLGGNRRGPARRYGNLMITMLLGGLWHGAAWTFVAWGGLHGLYLIVNHGWEQARSHFKLTTSSAVTRAASRVLTFLAVVVAWVFFRAQSFGTANVLLKGMAGHYGIAASSSPILKNLSFPFLAAGDYPSALAILVILVIAVWTLPNSQEILTAAFQPARPAIEGGRPFRLPFLVRWGLVDADGGLALGASSGFVVAGALLGAMIFQALRSTTLQPFIYFQF
jgi:alginate O-acetyltransferase complex protein AlgI